MSITSQLVSLLWRDGQPIASHRADTNLARDLNIKRLVRSLSLMPQYEQYVQSVILTLTTDIDTIRYRQAILKDLLRSPALVRQLEEVLDAIITLESYLVVPQWKDNLLRQVAWRLSELERFVDTVVALDDILTEASDNIQSEGLVKLRQAIKDTLGGEIFQQLRDELPTLIPQIRRIRSITVGINLDEEMRPVSATLLDTHQEPLAKESMLSRLLGMNKQEGILGPLHDARKISGIPDSQVELRDRKSPFMPALFKDLSELLDETSQPIIQTLRKYTQINSQFLIALKLDIAFYLGAVQMIKRVRESGLAMCEPEALSLEARTTDLDGLYNINLCLQYLAKQETTEHIVGNNARFDEDGRIFILTGPNQGGKTTYTQAVGLAHLLFQAGLYVPAKSARLSPVDNIHTHFAAEERPNLEAGRLGEEARRLNTIFNHATQYSLVLLNESLSSTAATESLFIAQDVVRAFRLLGVRAIFATHLHDLAADAPRLNEETDGDSRIISVVSQVEVEQDESGQTVQRTYKIVPSPPVSKSYAIELAARYGISFEQLKDSIEKRELS